MLYFETRYQQEILKRLRDLMKEERVARHIEKDILSLTRKALRTIYRIGIEEGIRENCEDLVRTVVRMRTGQEIGEGRINAKSAPVEGMRSEPLNKVT